MAFYPQWLHILAWASIAICLACALGLMIHTLLRPQKMAIMGVVWPITALYLGPVAVALYRRALPVSEKNAMSPAMKAAMERHKDDPPTLFQNTLAVFHCGAGCSLGDLVAETVVPALGITFAGAFRSKLILDFALAYILGITFSVLHHRSHARLVLWQRIARRRPR